MSHRRCRRAAAGAVAFACGLLAAGAGRSESSAQAPLAGQSLILITLDTTRADQISAYGGPEGLTPHIDRIGAEGALFENAYSQTNVTNPSHTAIFTGLYAIDSRVMNNRTSLPRANPDADTLAAAFRRAGYRTAAFVATPHAARTRLGVPGFDHYPDIRAVLDAEVIVSDAEAWLAAASNRPFFLWLHFFDPHVPYEPPAEYMRSFYRGDEHEGPRPTLAEVPEFLRSPPVVRRQFGAVRDPLYPIALYRAELHYVDAQIGRLVEHLRDAGLYESTGLVVVADHGESLGEHDIYYDHFGLYETTLRIPLIFRLPGLPAGIRVSERVGQVDLVPTLEKLYGIELVRSTPLHGSDLGPLLRGERVPELDKRTTIHEDAHNRQIAVRVGPWKLIAKVGEPWYERSDVLLFDLEQDPKELENIAHKHPAVTQKLVALVDRWVALGKWREMDEQISDADLSRLAALGYVTSPAKGAAGPEPSPEPPRARSREAPPRRRPLARSDRTPTVRELHASALSEDVGLSSEQRSQVEAIFEAAGRDLRELRRDPAVRGAALAFRTARVRRELQSAVEELMDEEQQRRYETALSGDAGKKAGSSGSSGDPGGSGDSGSR